MRQAVQPFATEADTQPLERCLVILRSLTLGARRERRFSFLIVDVPPVTDAIFFAILI